MLIFLLPVLISDLARERRSRSSKTAIPVAFWRLGYFALILRLDLPVIREHDRECSKVGSKPSGKTSA